MTELEQALEARAGRTEAPTVIDLLERMKPELARVLPDADRFARVVLTELRRTPKLLECTPESFLGAMMLSAQLGLEPGPLGHVYLVPFRREVTFVLGYKGMIHLAYASGALKSIRARTVYEGDEYGFYTTETGDHFRHTAASPKDRGEPIRYYASAALKTGGSSSIELWPEDVERAKARSAAGSNPLSPWTTDYDAMARKTAVRRLAPMLPQSPMFAQALAADEALAPALDEDAGLTEIAAPDAA